MSVQHVHRPILAHFSARKTLKRITHERGGGWGGFPYVMIALIRIREEGLKERRQMRTELQKGGVLFVRNVCNKYSVIDIITEQPIRFPLTEEETSLRKELRIAQHERGRKWRVSGGEKEGKMY